jgi:hypothetical protein
MISRVPTQDGISRAVFLWSPGIDSKELITSAYVAWRASTITLFLLGSYSPRLFKNSSSGLTHNSQINLWEGGGVPQLGGGVGGVVSCGLTICPSTDHGQCSSQGSVIVCLEWMKGGGGLRLDKIPRDV